jgi:hypothetical protein
VPAPDGQAAHDFVVRLLFDDGRERDVDLESELWGPVFVPLRESAELFRQVRVDAELGTIVWPKGADMDPDVRHGDFEPADSPVADARPRSR